MRLKDKVTLITGGAAGIGKALAFVELRTVVFADDLVEQPRLAAEMDVDHAVGDAGIPGDFGHRYRVVPVFGEQGSCRVEQPRAGFLPLDLLGRLAPWRCRRSDFHARLLTQAKRARHFFDFFT